MVSFTGFCTGILDVQNSTTEFKLYPNPSDKSATLEYRLQERTNVEIIIMDLTGKEIAVLQQGIQQEGKYIIPVESGRYQLRAGVYILKVIREPKHQQTTYKAE